MHLHHSNAMLLIAIFLMKNMLTQWTGIYWPFTVCSPFCGALLRRFRSCVLYYIVQWRLGERHDLIENGKLQECELLSAEKTASQPQLPPGMKGNASGKMRKGKTVFSHILVVHLSSQGNIFDLWVEKSWPHGSVLGWVSHSLPNSVFLVWLI